MVTRFGAAGRILFAAAALAGATAQAMDVAKGRGETRYSNKAWHWSILQPAGWTVEGRDPDIVRLRSPDGRALCSVNSGAMDRFNTVDEMTDFLLAHDEKFFRDKGQKFTVRARRSIRLANGIAGTDVLVEIGPGGRSRRVQVLIDGRGYAVDCEAYAKHWAALEGVYQRVIASFAVRR